MPVRRSLKDEKGRKHEAVYVQPVVCAYRKKARERVLVKEKECFCPESPSGSTQRLNERKKNSVRKRKGAEKAEIIIWSSEK